MMPGQMLREVSISLAGRVHHTCFSHVCQESASDWFLIASPQLQPISDVLLQRLLNSLSHMSFYMETLLRQETS